MQVIPQFADDMTPQMNKYIPSKDVDWPEARPKRRLGLMSMRKGRNEKPYLMMQVKFFCRSPASEG